MGQSRISTHLSQMRQAELVEDRRNGKNSIYRLNSELIDNRELIGLLGQAAKEIGELEKDRAALELVLRKRQDKMRSYFDGLAGKFGREYVPGRSWKALAEAMLKLMPPMVVADLGAGEGTLSQLLAQRAERVIAVDNSDRMVEFGKELAVRHGFQNLEFRTGDLEALPIEDNVIDLAVFSQSLHHAQHPVKAVSEAYRVLKPGGRIVVLDLLRHSFEDARELYADLWLGFPEVEIEGFMRQAGFVDVEASVVSREPDPPHFETLLVIGHKK